MSIIIFLIILSVLVVVHEAGHLFAAKNGGIRVDEFGLGFPPKIKKLFAWRGTDFFLNSLPFGGYVKIKGENPIEGEAVTEDSFLAKGRRRQIFVLAAGVIANFLLAWLLFSLVQFMGIEGQDGFVKRGILGSIWHGLLTTGMITWLTLEAICQLIYGALVGSADLTGVVGPVGLVGLVDTVKEAGLVYLFYFTGVISVNLGIINLVPIPALDGGRIFIIFIEWLRGKRVEPKTFHLLNTGSFVLLILLMVLVTIRDVNQLI